MTGYQLTFYTEQNRRHGNQTLCEWLLDQVRELGAGGATVISAAQGIGHAGAHHAAHFVALADQPMQIILALTEAETERLLQKVIDANVHLFYTKFPIEFGVLGMPDTHHGKGFDWHHPLAKPHAA